MAERVVNEILDPVYEDGIWKGAKITQPEGYFKLGERLLSQFKKYPDFVGQIDGATGEAETYKSMGERSVRCAIWLQHQGIIKGDVVGLCARNHLDSSMPVYASLYLGTIINPWRNVDSMNEKMVMNFIETTQPKMLFVDLDYAELVLEVIKNKKYVLPVVIFGQKHGLPSFDDILETPSSDEVDKFECVKIKAADPAVLLYTSGSTKSPKAALHSYHSTSNNIMMNYYVDDNKPSTIFWLSNLFWMSAITIILRSIISKAKMILFNDYNPVEYFRLIEKYKVTVISMTVFKAHAICKSTEVWKYDVSSVEHVATGGGVIKSREVEVMRRLFENAEIYGHYGGTEFGNLLTGKTKSNALNSSGKVFTNAEVKVVDLNTRKTVGPNEEGELLCRTPKLMTCYWNNPTATDEAIDSERWYHTGDFGYYDNNGDFFIIDKICELIKIPGMKSPGISSSVIECVIEELPGVADAGVVARPSSTGYDMLMAFVTKAPGIEVSEKDIHGIVEEKLPSVMKLQGGICFLEKMPYTPSLKCVNGELRKMAKAFADKSKF